MLAQQRWGKVFGNKEITKYRVFLFIRQILIVSSRRYFASLVGGGCHNPILIDLLSPKMRTTTGLNFFFFFFFFFFFIIIIIIIFFFFFFLLLLLLMPFLWVVCWVDYDNTITKVDRKWTPIVLRLNNDPVYQHTHNGECEKIALDGEQFGYYQYSWSKRGNSISFFPKCH